MIADGTLDAAIIRGSVRDPSLWRAHVWDERIVAAMPDHHPLAGRRSASLVELASTPVAIADRATNPALHDLLTHGLGDSGVSLTPGMPFTGVESTFAVLAAQHRPMWTPVFEGYEAEHPYEGMCAVPVEPPLTLPAFLVTSVRLRPPVRELLLNACLSSASDPVEAADRATSSHP